MRFLAKKVPVWLSATVIVLLVAVLAWGWTGVYTYNIEIMSMSAADAIYLPHTLTGVAWVDEIPLHHLRMQYTVYSGGYGEWVDVSTMRLEGWDVREESALTRRESLNRSFLTAGITYAVRIYVVDFDSNEFPNPDNMSLFESENCVAVFTVLEGVSPR